MTPPDASPLRWLQTREAAHDLAVTAVRAGARAGRRVAPARLRHSRAVRRLRASFPRSRRHLLAPVLEAIGHARPDAFFVQIGSNDGEQQDPLRDAIRRFSWSGIMVEPVPYVFDRLRRNYGHLPGITLENVAIADGDGEASLHHLAQATADDEAVPRWYDALGSFSLEVVRSHRSFIPDIDDRIVTTTVPTITFETLCKRHGVDRVDVLHIDTEGYDLEILKLIDLERLQPTVIIYEHHHLDDSDRPAAQALLRQWGYDLVEYGLDTWAFARSCLADHESAIAAVWASSRGRATAAMARARERAAEPAHVQAVIELSDEERRYLNSLYDDSVPLPEGAEAHLRPDNPLLVELRSTYEQIDGPVARHSQWDATKVTDYLDLAHFRGDSVYQWHYRELPRATRLKLFIYLTYIERRDDAQVLDRLAEDGAFGAWTYDYPGRAPISRDLLESANEILFLERHFGLLRTPDLRVLDIGAGYGRLADRMAEAVPGLRDYCCLDAVPESTFLCDYYLTYRGCAPVARTVPLHEVDGAPSGEGFDLAVNIHSFSECTYEAIAWWAARLRKWEVPKLFLIPNEPEGLLSTERDGTRRDAMPALVDAGYTLAVREPVIDEPAVRDLLRIDDHFHLFDAT